MRRPRVLFVSHDPVGEEMAGLGIRYTELAGVLASHHSVTIAHGGAHAGRLPSGATTVPFMPHEPSALRPLIETADVVIAHPQWPLAMDWLARSRARVIFDLYDPETFETLELFAGRRRPLRNLMVQLTLDRLHDALRTGHHFMCASESQRDLWLGALLSQRLLDPERYDADPALRDVIDVVPFGVPVEPPVAEPGAIGPRERFAAVGRDAELVLWNGGLWRWLDAETAIRAIALVAKRRPRVRLVFMGAAAVPAAKEATEAARALAASLGVLDRVVVFNDRWVAYAERAAWLTQADCALATHPDHVETRFAFRTRVLDCLWAGLPVVSTSGDWLGERIERDGLGATSPPREVEALAAAVEHVLDAGRASFAEPIARVAAEYRWPRVAAPLVRWAGLPGEVRTVGDAPGAAGPTPAHRARSAAYRFGFRRILHRRAG